MTVRDTMLPSGYAHDVLGQARGAATVGVMIVGAGKKRKNAACAVALAKPLNQRTKPMTEKPIHMQIDQPTRFIPLSALEKP